MANKLVEPVYDNGALWADKVTSVTATGAPTPQTGRTNVTIQRIRNGWLICPYNSYETACMSEATFCEKIEDIGKALIPILGSERLK